MKKNQISLIWFEDKLARKTKQNVWVRLFLCAKKYEGEMMT
ncbi:hypothetical protein MtrunA17_Chr1g0156111 [Medicago truncatula]|uniref:Uncharacterized protein n=1 Tax=Medicago truncatula TaxID=3880 RepID=A0A396JH31_MEDTR|nr:hypothetical protein MtrunA17_Chr1g0156111 [Medicago truncatula]